MCLTLHRIGSITFHQCISSMGEKIHLHVNIGSSHLCKPCLFGTRLPGGALQRESDIGLPFIKFPLWIWKGWGKWSRTGCVETRAGLSRWSIQLCTFYLESCSRRRRESNGYRWTCRCTQAQNPSSEPAVVCYRVDIRSQPGPLVIWSSLTSTFTLRLQS